MSKFQKMNLDKIIVSNNECSNQIKLHFDTQENLLLGVIKPWTWNTPSSKINPERSFVSCQRV